MGKHTADHLNLRHLNVAHLMREVTESKNERVIDNENLHFSYPFGSKNEASKREFEVLKGIGFKTCTTTRCANVFTNHHTHTNSLPRLNINNHLFSSHTSYYASGFIPALTNNFKRVVTD
ncbi:MAG: hypothetical protein JJU16_09085 [Alkalibacterium sp.]|nr:hypothetical protein [Alkalibacterium sp.]